MKIITLKYLFCFLLSLISFTEVAAQADLKKAYTLFDKSGKEISYGELIKNISGYDVVFIGEMHNCPITHWLEFEIVRSLYDLHHNDLMIGEEMFEAENQLIIDEYMQGKITMDRFEKEVRLWGNYETDYAPVVSFAKGHGIPFIATNIPRRYANSVSKDGLPALETFSEEAKKYMAPLPIHFEYDEVESKEAFGMMSMFGGKKNNMQYMSQAQAMKDATMAWFIAKNIKRKFVHINGSYHTDFKGGIIPYLLQYKPNTSIVTIVSVRQESIDKLSDENKERADFYICIPEDMVTSY